MEPLKAPHHLVLCTLHLALLRTSSIDDKELITYCFVLCTVGQLRPPSVYINRWICWISRFYAIRRLVCGMLGDGFFINCYRPSPALTRQLYWLFHRLPHTFHSVMSDPNSLTVRYFNRLILCLLLGANLCARYPNC